MGITGLVPMVTKPMVMNVAGMARSLAINLLEIGGSIFKESLPLEVFPLAGKIAYNS
jgi:hypothetical protein